jgi:adenylosuccinate synthase
LPKLAITKLDVLDGLKNVKICTKYKLNGKDIGYLPANIYDVEKCKPIYKDFKGWNNIDRNVINITDLPKETQDYLKFIEKDIKIPIAIVSIGPERKETIEV